MKFRRGDKVQIITGHYKGTIGDIIEVLPKINKIKVEGVNLVKKHVKPDPGNPEGGIFEIEAAIDASNALHYDAKAKEASRIRMSTNKKGEKIRVYVKSGAEVK